MQLSRFPRIRLGHLPTPLEPMPRLSALLGGPEIWIKRDDCTGLSTGGNKTRKLEFLMAEAVAMGADIVLTQGATQSNHARQTAAAAAKLGMDCHILLEDRTGYNEPNYRLNGNVLLDVLHGASIEHRGPGLDMNAEMMAVAERMKGEGRKPYAIVGGGSTYTPELIDGFARYRTDLPADGRRYAFSALASLLPGTLPTGFDENGVMLVHGLDVERPISAEFAAEEALFSRMLADE